MEGARAQAQGLPEVAGAPGTTREATDQKCLEQTQVASASVTTSSRRSPKTTRGTTPTTSPPSTPVKRRTMTQRWRPDQAGPHARVQRGRSTHISVVCSYGGHHIVDRHGQPPGHEYESKQKSARGATWRRANASTMSWSASENMSSQKVIGRQVERNRKRHR